MIRAALVKIHLWAGLAAGLFLAVAGLSGSVLAFGDEIDRALNPALFQVSPGASRISIQAAADAVHRAHPVDRVTSIRLPRDTDAPFEIATSRQAQVYVDPHDGHVIGERDRSASFVSRVHDLHTKLLLGAPGEIAVGASTSVLVFLIASGLCLWWPRRSRIKQGFLIRWRSPWRRLSFDLHSVLGFYASSALILISTTGAIMAWNGVTYPLIDRLTGSPPRPTAPPAKPIAGAPTLSLDEVAAIADKALPDAPTLAISLPAGAEGTYAVAKRTPEDRTPGGRSRVFIHPSTGEVLLAHSSRSAPLGTRIENRLRPLHTGDLFGLPGRVLYAAVSAWVAGLLVTGSLIWWGRRRRTAGDPPV